MKPLNFYIKESIVDEKLDINKMSLKDKDFVKKFPLNGKADEIRTYLLNNDFIEVDDKEHFIKYVENLNSMKTKVFSESLKQLRFADTSFGVISEENPIFAIDTGNRNGNVIATEINYWWEHKLSEEEFLDKLKERFD